MEATPETDDSQVIAIGTVLAERYRVDGILGAGGMGRVYRGEHAAMGKPVAIKVLHAALGRNQEAAVRFQREAVASGRLDHPNIVNVSDFGVLDGGALYLVMEALEGESLGQRLAREKTIPWPDALAIMRGVLLGLRHAHDRGVVHRDIKPDNIFLANKDGEGVVKLLDFGIAKLYANYRDDQNATRAGLTVGTPKYLSPEQAVGGAITPACDVYSASVVLYEMLVGRPPFDEDDALSLLSAHVGSEVPPFHELAPKLDVPDGLEELVRDGLHKMIADRIGSALEYVQRLDDILRANGIEVPALPAAPASPLGAHTPSPGFLTPTPLPFSVAPTELAPTARKRSTVAEPNVPPPRATITRRSMKRGRIVLAALALAGVAGLVVWLTHGDHPSRRPATAPAVASKPPAARTQHRGAPATRPEVPATPPPAAATPAAPRTRPATTPQPATVDRDKRLASALQTLQGGATCVARRKAIPVLVELKDRKAVPALRRAIARGKPNACLRASAGQAIKAIGSK